MLTFSLKRWKATIAKTKKEAVAARKSRRLAKQGPEMYIPRFGPRAFTALKMVAVLKHHE